jgi:hypothetical protein
MTFVAILVAMAWPLVGSGATQDTPQATMAPATPPSAEQADPALAAAVAMVEKSDRYLHHSRLKPGMKGYGLTVLSGTRPVRFDVEIISVMTRWGPHQDVILARLGGPDMERLGVSSGMSGSPVYVRDDRDGKDKLIGAVAFAFFATKEPICGIQPITQMLAIPQGSSPGTPGQPADATADSSDDKSSRELLAAAMDPRQTDLISVLGRVQGQRWRRSSPAGNELAPLATPLMIRGLSESTFQRLRQPFLEAGLMPVQAGGVSGQAADGNAAFVPGSAISISLATGDLDISAVGTVTDVTGDRLLALGHSLFAEGDVEIPIGPAQVHTVVPTLLISFKLGSGTGVSGAMVRDERVGVRAVLGRSASMIPVTVKVDWPDRGQSQQFHYAIARHRTYTPMLVSMVAEESASGWRDLPELHTVRHSVDIDFGSLGHYHAANVASGSSTNLAMTDLVRPLIVMLNNPLAPPATIKAIDVQITVEPADRSAEILDLRLDGRVYRPGDQVTGRATIKPFRKPRQTIAVRLDLPADLPDGSYTLTACDSGSATQLMVNEMPQRFDPRTVEDLFQAVQRLSEYQGDSLYLRLPLVGKNLAIGSKELTDLPESRKNILSQAALGSDAKTFTQSLVIPVSCDYVLVGEATATLEVQRELKQTPMR